MTHHIKSIIAHKFRSSWKFWNSALVPPSPPHSPWIILDSHHHIFPFFPLQPIYYPYQLIPPPKKKSYKIKISWSMPFPHNGTLLKQHYIRHSPIGSWNPESTLSLYSSFRLTISGKKKKLWSVMHILLRITLGKMFTKCLEKVCLVKKAHWQDHYTT